MFKKLAVAAIALLLTILPVAGAVTKVAALTTNPITNAGITGAGVTDPTSGVVSPAGWSAQTWTSVAGAITPTFQYVTTDGHNDSSSVKVTMANYDTTYVAGADDGQVGGALTGDDGDAKWIFDPMTVGAGANQLQAGKQYRFTMWYKTNTTPKIVVDFIDAAGVESFYGMSNPEPTAAAATTWTQYSNTFTVPATAQQVTTFAFLDRNGWLQTDDYSITDYTPTGFSEPLLTLTFDDGQEDNITNALPLIQQYGLKTTQCFETQTLINQPAQVTTNVMAFKNAGQEICSHTITHPMLTQINDTQLTNELQQSKSYLENAVGTTVPNFASPYGDYDARVVAAIKAAGYTSHRTVDEGFNSKDNYDPYRLRVQNIFNTTTAAQVADWVTQAKADNTWLVLVYHRVATTPAEAGQFDTDKALFKTHLDAIKASNIKVATMADALAETKAQVNGGGQPVDTTAPVVTAAASATGTTAQITWSTNEAFTTAQVVYGTTATYGSTAPYSQTGAQYVSTLSNLTAGTKYYYQISATDAAGNVGVTTGEFTMPTGTTNPIVLGDLDADGDVDGVDLSTLLGNWSKTDIPYLTATLGDLDGNGYVNGVDLSTLLGNWSK